MEKLYDCVINEALVNMDKSDVNYRNPKCIVISRERFNEVRALITILTDTINKKYYNKEIGKIELCLFLQNLNLNSESECFMLNIGINKFPYDNFKVTYKNAPNFIQQTFVYKFNNKFVNKYINFDITEIFNKINNCGITLLSLNSNSTAIFSSSMGDYKPYIKITLKEHVNNNNCNIVGNKNTYGIVVNNTGMMIKNNGCSIVLWDELNNTQNIILRDRGLIIKGAGTYRIDYYFNIKMNSSISMHVYINNVINKQSTRRLIPTDSLSTGVIIINTECDENRIDFVFNSEQIMLANCEMYSYVCISKIQ